MDITNCLPIGTKINGYRIIKHLDAGGFGITYLVENKFQKKFVIKEFFLAEYSERLPDQKVVPRKLSTDFSAVDYKRAEEQFYTEGFTLNKLNHPNIVQVFNIFEKDDTKYNTTYLVLEYIKGETLKKWISYRNTSTVLNNKWIQEIGDALKYLHRRSPPVLHLDIKPSNIMIETETNRAVLIDFGMSRQIIENKTGHKTNLGYSRSFSAPEQGGSTKLHPSLDVYALGATAFYIVTETKPSLTDLSALTSSSIPLSNKEAIQRAMQLEPTKRGTVADFLAQWQYEDENDNTIPPPVQDERGISTESTGFNKIYGIVGMLVLGALTTWWFAPNITSDNMQELRPNPDTTVIDSSTVFSIPVADTSTNKVDNSPQKKKDKVQLNDKKNKPDVGETKPIIKREEAPLPPPQIKPETAIIWTGTIIPKAAQVGHKQKIWLNIINKNEQIEGEIKISDMENESRWATFEISGTVAPDTQTLTIETTNFKKDSSDFNYCQFKLLFSNYFSGVGQLTGEFRAKSSIYKEGSGFNDECIRDRNIVTINRQAI